MENITEFINELIVGKGIVVAAASYVVAEIIKVSLPSLKYYIPLIGGILGLAMGALIPTIFPGEDHFTAAIMGMALGWAATGAFETVKGCRRC